MVFEGACVSCHGWTGQSLVSPTATLTAANVAQIVISGTKRLTPEGALSMPAFGNAYTDDEIAAVANYVTARFGAKGSKLTAKDVAELRQQASQYKRIPLSGRPAILFALVFMLVEALGDIFRGLLVAYLRKRFAIVLDNRLVVCLNREILRFQGLFFPAHGSLPRV